MTWTAALFFASLLSVAASAAEKYPVDSSLEGPDGPWSAALIRVAGTWPPGWILHDGLNPAGIKSRCIRTPAHPDLVGIEQAMRIAAPFSEVERVLDEVERFGDLFPGYESVKVIRRDANRIVSRWTKDMPILFPDLEWDLTYVVSSPRPGLKLYRFKLRGEGDMRSIDGLIGIQAEGQDGRTRYIELNSFEIGSGFLKGLAAGKIWRDGLRDFYRSGLAVKLKAEHSTWTHPHARDVAEKIADEYPPPDPEEKSRPCGSASEL